MLPCNETILVSDIMMKQSKISLCNCLHHDLHWMKSVQKVQEKQVGELRVEILLSEILIPTSRISRLVQQY